MSADVPRGACLQCEQTREEVRINRTICRSDFTPTTDLIRCTYIVDVAEKNDGVMVGDASYEFDRWFAAHDREVAKKAWGRRVYAREQVGQLSYVQGNNCAQD